MSTCTATEIEYGQAHPYADSIYSWAVTTCEKEKDKVLQWCREHLGKAPMEDEREFTLDTYAKLRQVNCDTYIYTIVHPFCD